MVRKFEDLSVDELEALLEDESARRSFDFVKVRADMMKVLVQARKDKGFSVKDVADSIGVFYLDLADIESGRSDPYFSTITEYASCVDVDLVKLTG